MTQAFCPHCGNEDKYPEAPICGFCGKRKPVYEASASSQPTPVAFAPSGSGQNPIVTVSSSEIDVDTLLAVELKQLDKLNTHNPFYRLGGRVFAEFMLRQELRNALAKKREIITDAALADIRQKVTEDFRRNEARIQSEIEEYESKRRAKTSAEIMMGAEEVNHALLLKRIERTREVKEKVLAVFDEGDDPDLIKAFLSGILEKYVESFETLPSDPSMIFDVMQKVRFDPTDQSPNDFDNLLNG